MYAPNALSVSITCSSKKNHYGCYQGNYFIPAKNSHINCFGYGCYYFGYIYIENEDVSLLEIKVNGCGECNSTNNCINYWRIGCQILGPDWYIYYDEYINYDIYNYDHKVINLVC